MAKDDIRNELSKDEDSEGRKKYFVDVDRMTNEGLAGGTVNPDDENAQIEHAADFPKEDPPHHVE